MRRTVLAATCAAVVAGGFIAAAPAGATKAERMDTIDAGPDLGHIKVHGAHAAGTSATGPNMSSHGGAVMNTAAITAIYWGSSWSNPTFTGDKIDGLGRWYRNVSGTRFAKTASEFGGANTTRFTGTTTFTGQYVDTAPATTGAPSTGQVLNEVAKTLAAHGQKPVSNGYYPVYVDTPRGSTNYCAWHSYGTISGTPVQFGFFFNLDGDWGCDPEDGGALGHSEGLAALANVTGHELLETVTDPRGAGWFDSTGAENADKCAWAFGSLVSLNGELWKLQGAWSNGSYNKQIGYPNLSGQKGCQPT